MAVAAFQDKDVMEEVASVEDVVVMASMVKNVAMAMNLAAFEDGHDRCRGGDE